MRNYKELEVWKRAILLAQEIYHITNKFPQSEIYGLTSQIRRASVSVSANIAEGSAFDSEKQFLKFMRIALGSACEVESLLLLSLKLGLVGEKKLAECDVVAIKKMLTAFIKSISARSASSLPVTRNLSPDGSSTEPGVKQ